MNRMAGELVGANELKIISSFENLPFHQIVKQIFHPETPFSDGLMGKQASKT